jgi:hypothetical protein
MLPNFFHTQHLTITPMGFKSGFVFLRNFKSLQLHEKETDKP